MPPAKEKTMLQYNSLKGIKVKFKTEKREKNAGWAAAGKSRNKS